MLRRRVCGAWRRRFPARPGHRRHRRGQPAGLGCVLVAPRLTAWGHQRRVRGPIFGDHQTAESSSDPRRPSRSAVIEVTSRCAGPGRARRPRWPGDPRWPRPTGASRHYTDDDRVLDSSAAGTRLPRWARLPDHFLRTKVRQCPRPAAGRSLEDVEPGCESCTRYGGLRRLLPRTPPGSPRCGRRSPSCWYRVGCSATARTSRPPG